MSCNAVENYVKIRYVYKNDKESACEMHWHTNATRKLTWGLLEGQ